MYKGKKSGCDPFAHLCFTDVVIKQREALLSERDSLFAGNGPSDWL